MEKVIASNKWERMISGTPYGEKKPVKITVTAKLYTLGDNDYPYFSITGDIKKMDKRYRNPYIMSGCIHEEILKYFPHLSPLVNVHLSAPDGLPMHAEANARYWAGLTPNSSGYNRKMLAQHLRVSLDLADQIQNALGNNLPWETITKHAKLIELWSDQAGKARALLNSHELAVPNA